MHPATNLLLKRSKLTDRMMKTSNFFETEMNFLNKIWLRPVSVGSRSAGCSLLLGVLLLGMPGFSQTRQAGARPANAFNLRNLQFGSFHSATRAMAMGGSAIALSDDPSAAMINPAGSALFSRPALSATTRLHSEKLREPTVDSRRGADILETRDINFDQPLISATVGLGGFQLGTFRETVFESRQKFEVQQLFRPEGSGPAEQILARNFPSRKVVVRNQIVDNGLSLATRFSQRLYLGASLRLTRLDFRLSERQYLESNWNRTVESGLRLSEFGIENLYLWQTVDERQTRAGFTAGILTRLSDRLLIGAVYNRRPSFDLISETFFPEFTVTRGDSTIRFPASTDGGRTIRFNLPDTWGIGVAYKYRGWMNLSVDLVRIRYSEMARAAEEFLLRDLIQNNHIAAPQQGPDLFLEDSWEVRGGLEYIFRLKSRRRLPVRVGYYQKTAGTFYAPGTAPDLQSVFPKAHKQHHYTGGLGIFFSEKLRIDGAADVSTAGFVLMGSSVYTF